MPKPRKSRASKSQASQAKSPKSNTTRSRELTVFALPSGSPQPYRFQVSEMSASDWADLGLRPLVARAAHGLVKLIISGGMTKLKKANAATTAFLEQMSVATEHEKLILQDVLVHSDIVAKSVPNGCGPDGFDYLVPDWFCVYTECCDEHDDCYAQGGTEGDRYLCDLTLYECMKQNGPDWLASYYFWGVRNFAQGSFAYKGQCKGVCEQTETQVTDLTAFRTMDRNGSTILNSVNASSRRALENKAREQSRVDSTRPCKDGCQCQADRVGAWTDRPTVLSITLRNPGGDLQGYARCDATLRTRTLSGNCVRA